MRGFCVASLLLVACGNPGGMGGDDDPSDVDAAIDGDSGGEWTMLVERSWSLGASVEAQRCRRIEVPNDLYITGFRVLAPDGTHHTLVSLSPNGTQMGDYDCAAANLDPALLFAGGKGSDDVLFPDGVAVKLAKGSFITLNLHLYNANDSTITNATSGVYIKSIPASQVVHEADMMFAGTTDISIPGNNVPYSVTGGCTAPMTWNVFTIWPHMHAYAMRQQVRVRRGVSTESLLDAAYVFDEQRNYPMSAVRQINAGDVIEVECTYQNDSGVTVFYGDSALQEMCFAGMYKYPKGGQSPGCIDMP